MDWIAAEKWSLYEKMILNVVREHDVVSRTTINKMTGIRFSTITNITKGLLTKKILFEVNENANDFGPHVSKKALVLNKDFCYVVGVDVQSSKIVAVLTDFCGNILSDIVIPFFEKPSQSEIKAAILRATDCILERAKRKRILGIGISTIGLLDRKTKDIMMVSENPNWMGLNFISLMAEHYPQYQIFVEDQTVCKLCAERWFSKQPSYENTVYVDISDVFGASMMFDGTPMRNKTGTIGEIGHFPVSSGNELCTCGNQGCLATVASASIIVRQVRQALEQGTMSILKEMTQGDFGKLTIQMILDAAEQDDRLSIHFLSGAAHYIGKAISYVVNLLGTEEVILGGTMITDSNFFTNEIVKETKAYTLHLLAKKLHFRKAVIRPFGGALGAVCIVLDDFFENYSLINE